MHPLRKLDIGHQEKVISGPHRILGRVGDKLELRQLGFDSPAAADIAMERLRGQVKPSHVISWLAQTDLEE